MIMLSQSRSVPLVEALERTSHNSRSLFESHVIYRSSVYVGEERQQVWNYGWGIDKVASREWEADENSVMSTSCRRWSMQRSDFHGRSHSVKRIGLCGSLLRTHYILYNFRFGTDMIRKCLDDQNHVQKIDRSNIWQIRRRVRLMRSIVF